MRITKAISRKLFWGDQEEWFLKRFPRGTSARQLYAALCEDSKKDWIVWLLAQDAALTREFVAAGADVTAKERDGTTPLYYAALHHRKGVADVLIKAGARVDVFAASALGLLGVVRASLQRDPTLVAAKDGCGRIPLHLAVMSGHTRVMRLLVASGADVNSKDRYDETPLHEAALSNQDAVASFLIASGAEVNARNDDGATPLHYASYWSSARVVKILIKSGAKVDARDGSGWTPLHNAAHLGNSGAARVLIAHGAPVNVRDPQGWTPLRTAEDREWRRPGNRKAAVRLENVAAVLRRHGATT